MNFLTDIFKGIFIGIANAIPGVSGGTLMVSMGIYDKIIHAITTIFKQFVQSVKTLTPYAVGAALGIVGLAYSIGYLFKHFPFQTAMGFIGLIYGGLPILLRKVRGRKPEGAGIVLFVIFFAIIIAMLFVNTDKKEAAETVVVTKTIDTADFHAEETAVIAKPANAHFDLNAVTIVGLFVIGVIAAATMIIPGVSGSMVLLALGYYHAIMAAIKGFIEAAVALNIPHALYYVIVLVPFGLGVLFGIYEMARLVEYLLRKHERLTYFAILGLVFASPIAILCNKTDDGAGVFDNFTLVAGIMGAVMFAIGFDIALLLSKDEAHTSGEHKTKKSFRELFGFH